MPNSADQGTLTFEHILGRFVAWANREPNIRGALLIGSQARQEQPADAWSDMDLIILAQDPTPLWQDDTWCREMGDVWLSFTEPTASGGKERRVLYQGGLDVDYVLEDAQLMAQVAEHGLPPMAEDMLARGFCVVVDKDGLAPLLARTSMTVQPYQPPDAATYSNLMADALFHIVWTAKRLRRGELWRGKYCCDVYLKEKLLALLTWHTHALRPEVDTWVGGRYVETWADPRALAALGQAYAHHDVDDVWRALGATFDLLRWLGRETASALDLCYPTDADQHVARWLEQIEGERHDDQPPAPQGGTPHAD